MQTRNEVKAYRYYPYFFTGKSFWPTVEYWIPEYGIVCGSKFCRLSSEPANDANSRHIGKMGTLTATTISKELAEHLKSIATPPSPPQNLSDAPRSPIGPGYLASIHDSIHDEIDDLYKKEWSALCSWPREIDQSYANVVSSRKPSVKREFSKALEMNGNDALKQAFKYYILNAELPNNTTVDDLFAIYNKLDEYEKKSIHKSLSSELMFKSTIDKTSTLPRAASRKLTTTCQMVAAASAFGGWLGENSLVTICGPLLSGATFFAAKAYDAYQEPYLLEARNQRLKEVFNVLIPQHVARRFI